MAARRISHEEFRLNETPQKVGPFALLTREIEWYSDVETHRLGIILYDLQDKDYSFVVFEQIAGSGMFHAIDLSTSNPTVEEARRKLAEAMSDQRTANGQN